MPSATRVERGAARVGIAQDVVARLQRPARLRGQFGARRAAPRVDEIARHLHVALEADVPIVDDIAWFGL
jgi:hypothetical protein